MSIRRHRSSLRVPVVLGAVVAVLAVLGGPLAGGRAHAAAGTLVSACGGTIGCPNKINLRGAVDTLTFQARITATTPTSPATEPFVVTVRNANGVVFSGILAAGNLRQEGRRFQFRDPGAKKAGGFSRVTLRPKGANGWRLTVIAHGDMSAATLATMSVEISLGDDTFATVNPWSRREFGWLLHLPAGVNPPPTPTPGPTATPLPTPSIAPTPVVTPTPVGPTPTPTENPYGSVFGAFVQPPPDLLR
jgi:hypothetical protein